MYCINCGVELADHERKCPLCGTEVMNPAFLHPDAPAPYPRQEEPREEINRHGILFILSFLFLLPITLTLVCDLGLNGRMVWSGYPIGALLLGYLLLVLPFWFQHPNPIVFIPLDFAGVLLYLGLLNILVHGQWFFTFAMPVTVLIGALVTAQVALVRYLKGRGILFVLGGGFLAAGLCAVVSELLLDATLGYSPMLNWAGYPLAVFSLLGIMLIIIGLCPPLRESLKKKFFV